MLERESRDWVFEAFQYGSKTFTKKDVTRIVKKVGLPLPTEMIEGNVENPKTMMIETGLVARETLVWQWLNNSLVLAGIAKFHAGKPTASDMRERLSAISSHANALLEKMIVKDEAKNLSFEETPEHQLLEPAIFEPLLHASLRDNQEPGAIRDIVIGLRNLRQWSSEASGETARKVKDSQKRHEGKKDITALFRSWASTWRIAWNRTPTADINDPFRRFCSALVAHLQLKSKSKNDFESQQLTYQINKVLGGVPTAPSHSKKLKAE